MNFIRKHIISSIQNLYEANRQFASGGFIYFDEHIDIPSGRKINRINGQNAYCHEEIVPMAWNAVSGKGLQEIKESLKEGRFYSYRNIEGKSYKIRKKK